MPVRHFWLFLEEGYRREARETLRLISIVTHPHVKQEDARSTINSVRRAIQDPLDYLQENNDYSGLEDIRKSMGD